MSDRELLDHIIAIFPAEKPGCVSLSQFHSQMLNTVLPAYAKLKQDTLKVDETTSVLLSEAPYGVREHNEWVDKTLEEIDFEPLRDLVEGLRENDRTDVV